MKAATRIYLTSGALISISIHAAREGGDNGKIVAVPVADISIHAAREGGDHDDDDRRRKTAISIHAAREGGDCAQVVADSCDQFQSTPPVKAATAETNRRNQHFRKQQV